MFVFISSSARTIPLTIFCSGGLVVMNYFVFVYHGSFLICSSIMKDTFVDTVI
jgi:hypothetical protein